MYVFAIWNIAIIKKECHVTNKIKFCYNHLANCENFKKWYDESECAEILALGNDDNNKNNKDNENTSNTSKRKR